MGYVVQESSNILMVDSSPGSSGYSGWSNEKTRWPGWMGDGLSRKPVPKDVRVGGSVRKVIVLLLCKLHKVEM